MIPREGETLSVITLGVLQESWAYRRTAIEMLDDEKVFAWQAAFDRLLDRWLEERPELSWKTSESVAA